METTEILQRVTDLHDSYLDITSQMTKFAREIIEANGGKITMELDEDGYVDNDCNPVIITMWDKNGHNENVEVLGIELDGDTILVKDICYDSYMVYPEHIYEVLEFIGIWSDCQSKIKKS